MFYNKKRKSQEKPKKTIVVFCGYKRPAESLQLPFLWFRTKRKGVPELCGMSEKDVRLCAPLRAARDGKKAAGSCGDLLVSHSEVILVKKGRLGKAGNTHFTAKMFKSIGGCHAAARGSGQKT